MSYTFNAPDPDLGKEVDFDFFESTGGTESPTNLGSSSKVKKDSNATSTPSNKRKDKNSAENGCEQGRGKEQSPRLSETSDDGSSDESYSSNYTSASSVSSKHSNKNVRKIEAKIPQVENDDENTARSNRDDEKRGHISRPKTSLQKRGRRSRSYSSESDHSYSSNSTSDTDSDVTDVSPLHTPHTSGDRQSQKGGSHGKPPISPLHKEVTFKRPPSSTSSRASTKRSLTRATSDDIDLRLLMQAVMEMERNYNPKLASPASTRHRPVFNMPQKNPTSINRKNFSFSNEDVRSIDQENQRLMQQIMKYAVKNKKKKKKTQKPVMPTSPNRMSSSAINRNREQMRIERENFALLQRLNAAKATRDLAREKLIKDYQSHLLFGCSVAAAHPLEKKKKSPYTVTFNPRFTSFSELSALPHSGKRTRPASAVVHGSRPMSGKTHAVRPVSASVTRAARPVSASSAGRRPLSAKVVGTVTKETSPGNKSRPAWENKW